MNLNRHPEKAGYVTPSAQPTNAEGQRLCRHCQTAMRQGSKRKTFCSAARVDAHCLDTQRERQRRFIFLRDQGLCAECRFDTEAFKRAIEQDFALIASFSIAVEVLPARKHLLERAVQDLLDRNWSPKLVQVFDHEAWLGYTPTWKSGRGYSIFRRSLWDMDHVIEVVRGGGGERFIAGNMQTLCRGCHAVKTARLAAERAAVRKLGKALARLGWAWPLRLLPLERQPMTLPGMVTSVLEWHKQGRKKL